MHNFMYMLYAINSVIFFFHPNKKPQMCFVFQLSDPLDPISSASHWSALQLALSFLQFFFSPSYGPLPCPLLSSPQNQAESKTRGEGRRKNTIHLTHRGPVADRWTRRVARHATIRRCCVRARHRSFLFRPSISLSLARSLPLGLSSLFSCFPLEAISINESLDRARITRTRWLA